MNNREIRPGSTWRNVHGEVEVKRTGIGLVSIWMGGRLQEWHEDDFRATHGWVSDPVEKPKVGSWVKRRGKVWFVQRNYTCMAVSGERRDAFVLTAWGDADSVSTEREFASLTPCDPPPLVKALDDLVSRCGDIHILSPGYFLPAWFAASVKAVINEWRAIKSQIGGGE